MSEDIDVLRIANTLNLTLHYNSSFADGSNARMQTVSGLGWTHTYDLFITEYRFDAYLFRGTGRETKFVRLPNGSYSPTNGWFETLAKPDANTYILTDKNGVGYRFEKLNPAPFLMPGPPFYIKSITNTNGLQTSFQYNANGLLAKIIDAYGREVAFAYNSDKKIQSITDPLGRVTNLVYGPQSYDLIKVTDAESKSAIFQYNSSHQIVGKTDKSGNSFTIGYALGKPVSESDSSGRSLFSLSSSTNWAVDNKTALLQNLRQYIPPESVLTIV